MTTAMTPRVLEWRARGELTELAGHQIFTCRHAGSGPLLLFLHGFPSSSYDWRATLGLLDECSWLTLDFLGFGLSDKPRDAVYSLFDQADIVEQLVAGEPCPVVLVAHDMGTSVATELLARDLEGTLSFRLAGVLLFNGSVIIARASLTWAQTALRSTLGVIPAAEQPASVRPPPRLPVLRVSPPERRRGTGPVGALVPRRRPSARPPPGALHQTSAEPRRRAGTARWARSAGHRAAPFGHYPQIEQAPSDSPC